MARKAVFYIANALTLAAIAHVFWWGWGLPDPRHLPDVPQVPAPASVEKGVPA